MTVDKRVMFSAVFLKIFCLSVHAYMCQFKCVYEHKLYSTKHVILWAGECVNVYAEAEVFFWAYEWIMHGADRVFENLFLSQCQL